MSELCLGTVQFGMKYGINNKEGQPSEEACFEMLDAALESGVSVIDTARAYGTAELILGRYIASRNCRDRLKLISKLRPNIIEEGTRDKYSIIRGEFEGSLERLHVLSLDGYLLHTPQYITDDGIIDALFRLKEEGLVKNIGVSIYDMKEGFQAIERGVDYVQLPYSVLDQRGEQTGFMTQAKCAGITVFVRSVFLQGLFMMNLNEVPPHLERARPYLEYFERLLEKYGLDKVDALVQFVKANEDIDYLVFGVDQLSQLTDDIKSFEKKNVISREFLQEVKEHFTDVEDSIILPSLWSNGRKAE